MTDVSANGWVWTLSIYLRGIQLICVNALTVSSILWITVIEVAIGEYEADKDKLAAAASCLGRNTFTSAIIGQREYQYSDATVDSKEERTKRSICFSFRILLGQKYRKQNPTLSSDEIVEYTKSQPKGPPAILQAFYLFSRSITSIRRNKVRWRPAEGQTSIVVAKMRWVMRYVVVVLGFSRSFY